MNVERQPAVAEPNVLTSIWNHWTLVATFAGVFAILGLFITAIRPSQYAAEAGMVLEDPQATVLSQARTAGDQLRYTADQVAILKSFAVSERASAVAAAATDPKSIDADDLRRRTSIRSSADSNYIVIRFRAGDPDTAAAGANAIVRGYRDLIRADLEADAAAAIARLDLALATTAATLSELLAADADPDRPGSVLRQRKQDEALALMSELRSRRNRLQVNAELTGDGVALFSPAAPGKAQGVSLRAALVVALILGSLIGAGLAYWLDARKRAFSSWLEPQVLLDSPALAEVPDFTREGVRSNLPVLHAPGTESAEAFRFLASGLGLPREPSKKAQWAATSRQRASGGANRSVAFVSASFGDGTTTLAANTALAAAQEGHRVLALDADVERHGLTRLLLGDDALTIDGAEVTPVGLSDMLRDGTSAEGIRRVMGTRAGGTLSLLGPGTATLRSDDVFRSEQILAALDSIRDQFDLVLIDVPPILHVAYADALLRSVGAVVVVVRHRSAAARLKHVTDRLDLLGVGPIGYVYNFAPGRRDVGRSMTQELLDRAEVVVELARGRAKKAVAR
jgi:Mrp family chromosome partitioning ATPase